MKVAVTGASGHVGANLCRMLLQKGFDLKVLVHHDERALDGLSVEKIRGSVHDTASLRRLAEGADTVIHLAARISILNSRSEAIRHINVTGTKNMLEQSIAAGVRRFIYFSSIHALEQHPLSEKLDESRPLVEYNPLPYEMTKAEAEKYVTDMNGRGIETIILNPTAILGPNDYYPSLMGQVLIKLYRRTLPGLIPGGYDWVDVRDISEAVIEAISSGTPGERYILSGKWADLKTLAEIVGQVSGRKPVRREFSMGMARLGVPFMRLYSWLKNEDALYSFETLKIVKGGSAMISHEKSTKELNFRPRPLEETVKDSIDWFRQEGYI